ncbi:MAG: FAD-binding protein [Acidobacteria bacterium]|nr:FAD-binding protein [Acidobacteriota bacterium]
MTHLATDVLVVGAGGAGMYAAVAVAREGRSVLLLDKGLVGRGGATIMAQMTVAAAIAHEEPDDWTLHLEDTLDAGRGICHEPLSRMLCERAPERILEMDRWGTRWARENGHIKQVTAPGHRRKRCCYVDFLSTGPAVAATLRHQVSIADRVRRVSNVAAIEVCVADGRVRGAVALDLSTGSLVTMAARAVVLAAGGLTKIFRRNSASTNMGGEAYWLALEAGAELVDMEFVQFFPIAHLAPRLVGMDPIMWDPFRYKLGGRLLNGNFEEFIHRYGGQDEGRYTAPRDLASYAILKEVEAGRGSPHGGVYLDFRHLPEATVRSAFGPVIDRLLANGIDLTRTAVEVAPTAHYHMGGIAVDERLETRVAGLFAAGEAVGGPGGANRVSGNAISEALVFGERAGFFAAETAAGADPGWSPAYAERARAELADLRARKGSGPAPGVVSTELQDAMWEHAGPFRSEEGLERALARIHALRRRLPELTIAAGDVFNLDVQDWYELNAMLRSAEAVASSALRRRESRGAHQRLDAPQMSPAFEKNQRVALDHGVLTSRWSPVVRSGVRTA